MFCSSMVRSRSRSRSRNSYAAQVIVWWSTVLSSTRNVILVDANGQSLEKTKWLRRGGSWDLGSSSRHGAVAIVIQK